MADLKISQLNAAAALTGAELVECVQGGANVQTTAQAIVDLTPSDGEKITLAQAHAIALSF